MGKTTQELINGRCPYYQGLIEESKQLSIGSWQPARQAVRQPDVHSGGDGLAAG